MPGSSHPQFCKHADRIPPTVLHESSRDDLKRVRDRTVWPAFNSRDAASARVQANTDGHLGCATTWGEKRVEHDIPRDSHRVREVAIDLVEDILRRPSQKDSARLGRTALG